MCGIAFIGLTGCKEQGPEIVRLKVPRVEGKIKVPEKDRMLAVLVTEKDKTWSFRLSGPVPDVTKQKEKFDAFVKSVKFQEKPPLVWTLPEGWNEGKGDPIRFATIKTGPEPKALEVTVFELPKEGGALLPNINRWRGQLELPPVNEKELGDIVTKIDVDGRVGAMVDLVGQFGAKGNMPPMKAPPKMPPPPPKQEAPPPLKYVVPEGWAKVKPKNQMIADQFDVAEGKDKAEVTIVILPGAAGGIEDNIQRWRGQVKLPPAKDLEEMLKDFRKIDTGLGKAAMVDLTNAKAEGNNRLMGIIIPLPEATYFVKVIGPSDLVGKHKDRFETFAKSLKFDR